MRRLGLIFSLLLIAPFLRAAAGCEAQTAAGGEGRQGAVDHYIVDNLLHRRWAVTVDCGHPERPWRTVEVAWRKPDAVRMPAIALKPPLPHAPVVKAGSKVEVWRTAGDSKVRLYGTAVDAGAEGQAVHVRLSQSTAVLVGRVRGPGSVELTAPGRWESQ